MKVVVSKNGPYLVSGGVPLSLQRIVSNEEGYSWDWSEERKFDTGPSYKLCRCGRSENMPFCDDTHLKVGFDGTETASRQPFSAQAKTYEGQTLELADAKALCASARFCHPGGKTWSLIRQADSAARDLAIREAAHCPSGRLVLHDKKSGNELEEMLKPSICVVEDSPLGCSGPLWVRGGIRIESEDGEPYEQRNRVTLCRCGASKNKPFCNGGHAVIKFRDGLVDLVRSPVVR
jgi:CDGSH-type Zn-finger protein